MLIYCSKTRRPSHRDAIREGKDGGTGGRRVWIIRSFDAGGNWTAPPEDTTREARRVDVVCDGAGRRDRAAQRDAHRARDACRGASRPSAAAQASLMSSLTTLE